MQDVYFILADCNNFYVSCERLLNPKLENQPVVVLSNNDGCVISRSQEAKDLGIKMGDPYFKIKRFCEWKKIIIRSSNYKLYGDISRRIMNIYAEMAPEIEVYSIDEAFLKYSPSMDGSDLVALAEALRQLVKRWVGIPISLGIAKTKTLAKLANNLAKKSKKTVFDLSSKDIQEQYFDSLPIGEIWGIGSRLDKRLKSRGIQTVEDFIKADPLLIRKEMGVIGARMQGELCGMNCLDLEEISSKKSITCSRSFGEALTDVSLIAEALSTFVARASLKLRRQHSYTKAIYVFLETGKDEGGKYQRLHFSETATFLVPTQDTSEIITAAKKCLNRLFESNQRYKKCGIILGDLIDEEKIIPDLFLGNPDPQRKAVMEVVDQLNRRFGKNKLFFGAMGVSSNEEWKMRSEFHSLYNTTSWNHLPVVKTAEFKG